MDANNTITTYTVDIDMIHEEKYNINMTTGLVISRQCTVNKLNVNPFKHCVKQMQLNRVA